MSLPRLRKTQSTQACPMILGRKDSGDREQQSVYELVTHDDKTGVKKIDSQQKRPDFAEFGIEKAALFRRREILALSPQAEKINDYPGI